MIPRNILSIRSVLAIGLVCSMSSCQSVGPNDESAATGTQTGINTAVSRTEDGLGDALMTPLSDLNMRRKQIPALLRTYTTAYDPISDPSCTGLVAEIERLGTVLGPDSDDDAEELSKGQKAGKAASDMTLGAVSGTSRSILPFSGLIRSASGASSYERRYQLAFKTAFERRAYLKGVGRTKGCAPPAAPLPLTVE